MLRGLKQNPTRKMAYRIMGYLIDANRIYKSGDFYVNVREMAELFELSERTICRYIKDYEELFECEILKKR